MTTVPKRPGISETTLRSAEIRYSDYPEPGSIEIPYWTAQGDLRKFKRWRLPHVRVNGQKYHQEPGSGVYAYFPPGFFPHHHDCKFNLPLNSVFLPEGEFKALSLLEFGIYAIGLPSFVVYLRDQNEHRRLLRDLQVTFSREKIQAIYFLGDADTATNFEFSRQATFLAGAAFPAKVFLPRIPLSSPKGIDDCREALGTNFDAFFAELIKLAIPLPKKIDAVGLALLLFEREVASLRATTGIEREQQFDRTVRLCAAAQNYAQSHATARLHRLAGDVMGITLTQLKAAIKQFERVESSTTDSDGEKSAAAQQAHVLATTQAMSAYYDHQHKEYIVAVGPSHYQTRTEAQFKRELRFRELTRDRIPGRNWSQIDVALHYFQEQKFVDYCGGLAGRNCGLYEENGSKILVTKEPRLIVPNKGQWGILNKFFANLVGGPDEPYGDEQLTVFYGWIRTAYQALREHRFQPGQALAIAGPVDSGKSLLQSLITEILGGRSAKAMLYLQGRTDFNGELFEAEHLVLEDEAASTLHRDRITLGASLKNLIANRIHPCHAKHRQIVNLAPLWRVSLSLNDRPERLFVLPPLAEDMADKIILLRASKSPMPMHVVTPEQKEIFWKTLVSELPAFLYWLLNEFELSGDWKDARFGVNTFHHPELARELEELSPVMALLALIDAADIWTSYDSATGIQGVIDPWVGTALELRRLLMANQKTQRDATRLLDWVNACAQYLNDLADRRPSRVKAFRKATLRWFEIYREIQDSKNREVK
jgi:hypothetical protein